ncbi:hypothetical protein A4A49_27118 [Nicotiana attenuata]|uniref:Uncharacterized protein n=1 Tax=Nicotiana attenuata TaxID=49451 RepID=A0A314LA29_NICAT|nr:hypothetical protein A4A49_27118 [Nicotiana attenuata]
MLKKVHILFRSKLIKIPNSYPCIFLYFAFGVLLFQLQTYKSFSQLCYLLNFVSMHVRCLDGLLRKFLNSFLHILITFHH